MLEVIDMSRYNYHDISLKRGLTEKFYLNATYENIVCNYNLHISSFNSLLAVVENVSKRVSTCFAQQFSGSCQDRLKLKCS